LSLWISNKVEKIDIGEKMIIGQNQKTVLTIKKYDSEPYLTISRGDTYSLFGIEDSIATFGRDLIKYSIVPFIGIEDRVESMPNTQVPQNTGTITLNLALHSLREHNGKHSDYTSIRRLDVYLAETMRETPFNFKEGECIITIPSEPLVFVYQAMQLIRAGNKLGSGEGYFVDDLAKSYNLVKEFHQKKDQLSRLSAWRRNRKISKFIKNQQIQRKHWFYSGLRREDVCIDIAERVEDVIRLYLEPSQIELEHPQLVEKGVLPYDDNHRKINFDGLTELIIKNEK